MSKFHFNKRKINTDQLLNVMANEAVNYFKVDVFEQEGIDGQKWKSRKDNDSSRRLLVKTGHMRQSIRVMKKGKNFRQVGTDIPYAQYHNKGTEHIPQRKFIGQSKTLARKLNRFVEKAVKTGLRKVA